MYALQRGRHLGWLAVILALLTLAGCSNQTAAGSVSDTKPTQQVGGDAPSPPAIAPGSASPGIAAVPSPSASPGTYTVNMTANRTFDPISITVPKGATITWHNVGGTTHTVTDDPAKATTPAHAVLPGGVQPWDSGNVADGQSFSMKFDTAGTYRYFCTIHEGAGMLADIVVTAQ